MAPRPSWQGRPIAGSAVTGGLDPAVLAPDAPAAAALPLDDAIRRLTR